MPSRPAVRWIVGAIRIARACPQYEGKIVNAVEPNMVFGASRYPRNQAITAVEDAAKEASVTGASAFHATYFGKSRD